MAASGCFFFHLKFQDLIAADLERLFPTQYVTGTHRHPVLKHPIEIKLPGPATVFAGRPHSAHGSRSGIGYLPVFEKAEPVRAIFAPACVAKKWRPRREIQNIAQRYLRFVPFENQRSLVIQHSPAFRKP